MRGLGLIRTRATPFITMNNSNVRRPTGPRGRPVKKTKQGTSAMATIYKAAKDQVARVVKNRYTGSNGSLLRLGRDVSLLMSMVNTEDKKVDNIAAAANCLSTTPIVYGIGTMAQGTTSAARIGNSIKINRIDLNMDFVYSTGTPATMNTGLQSFRYFLVKYLKTPSTNGTVAFATSEFLNVDVNGNYTTMSFPNSDTNENFQILAEGEVNIDLPVIGTVSIGSHRQVSLTRQCDFHQDYSGSAATTITDNMVWLVIVARFGANAGGVSQVEINARTWYIDN